MIKKCPTCNSSRFRKDLFVADRYVCLKCGYINEKNITIDEVEEILNARMERI